MYKLYSHDDLDGVSCAIVAQVLLGEEEIDYTCCKQGTLNDLLSDFILNEEYKKYEVCFITDMSVNEEIAEKIEGLVNLGYNFVLLDHHPTAEWLNKYEWCKVQIQYSPEVKCCGTSLLFDFLKKDVTCVDKTLTEYVEKVRRYDTWHWKDLNDVDAKYLNDLLYILGTERFIENWFKICTLPADTGFGFNAYQTDLLEMNQRNIDKYIDKKDATLTVKSFNELNIGVVFAERFKSELGNVLAERHPELDFIAIIDMDGSVGLRSCTDNIHLGEYAKCYGGGGHQRSAGFPIPPEERQKLIDAIFSRELGSN